MNHAKVALVDNVATHHVWVGVVSDNVVMILRFLHSLPGAGLVFKLRGFRKVFFDGSLPCDGRRGEGKQTLTRVLSLLTRALATTYKVPCAS